ncbi:unnamed protein product [Linum trigynum]|uniref:Uncharacterized protein n=1 Tax=Linum trigynum TaxID=586398 RepID=A0AAV2CY13_9ROSI
MVTSWCPVTQSTVIHLTIVDVSGDVAVIFTSRHLRRIASAVLSSDDVLHADFNTILHSLDGQLYELLDKVGHGTLLCSIVI